MKSHDFAALCSTRQQCSVCACTGQSWEPNGRFARNVQLVGVYHCIRVAHHHFTISSENVIWRKLGVLCG